jgi:hypothetical protein
LFPQTPRDAAFATFSIQQAELVPVWRQIVLDFEADAKKKNPYEAVFRGT